MNLVPSIYLNWFYLVDCISSAVIWAAKLPVLIFNSISEDEFNWDLLLVKSEFFKELLFFVSQAKVILAIFNILQGQYTFFYFHYSDLVFKILPFLLDLQTAKSKKFRSYVKIRIHAQNGRRNTYDQSYLSCSNQRFTQYPG